MTLIAVTSQNRREVTEHAGRCRNFLVYEVDGVRIGQPQLIELPLGGSLHDMAPGQAHPLDEVDVLISASMGDGLRVKLAERGILACLTNETEPKIALQRYLAGELPTQDPPLQTHPHGHAEDLAQPGRQNSGHGGCGHCHCGHAAGDDHDAMKTAP